MTNPTAIFKMKGLQNLINPLSEKCSICDKPIKKSSGDLFFTCEDGSLECIKCYNNLEALNKKQIKSVI